MPARSPPPFSITTVNALCVWSDAQHCYRESLALNRGFHEFLRANEYVTCVRLTSAFLMNYASPTFTVHEQDVWYVVLKLKKTSSFHSLMRSCCVGYSVLPNPYDLRTGLNFRFHTIRSHPVSTTLYVSSSWTKLVTLFNLSDTEVLPGSGSMANYWRTLCKKDDGPPINLSSTT